MSKYHITAKKEINECNCVSCRAKYGTFDSKSLAEEKLKELLAAGNPGDSTVSKKSKDKIKFNVSLPKDDVEKSPVKPEETKTVVTTVDEIALLSDDDHEILVDEEETGIPVVKGAGASNYFDEDEAFVKKSQSKVIKTDGTSAALKIDENTILVSVDGLYDEEGKRISKRQLSRQWPMLIIENSNGENVKLLLDKEMNEVIRTITTDVYRAYHNVSQQKDSILQTGAIKRNSDLPAEERLSAGESITKWIADHPGFSIGMVFILVLVVVATFAQ